MSSRPASASVELIRRPARAPAVQGLEWTGERRKRPVDLNAAPLLQKGMTWGCRLLDAEDSCTWSHPPQPLPRPEGGCVREQPLPTPQPVGIPERQSHVSPTVCS